MQSKEELLHYGIPGMKWGVRKGPTLTGTRSEDRKRVDNLLKKHLGDMSDQDLQTVINRLSRETQVKNLTKKPPSALDKFGKALAGVAIKTGAGLLTNRLISKYANIDTDALRKAGKTEKQIKELENIAKVKENFFKTLNNDLFQQQKKKD